MRKGTLISCAVLVLWTASAAFGAERLLITNGLDRAPVFDPYATLVLACGTENLEKVYVGGELLSEFRRPLKHKGEPGTRERAGRSSAEACDSWLAESTM